jgi:outer membrane protein OmpU
MLVELAFSKNANTRNYQMKNILLTTALVGFAGAAAADGHTGVSFGGNADIEYNDNDGFSYGLGLDVGASAELDNGLTAAASFTFELGDAYCYGGASSASPVDDLYNNVCLADYELSLTSATAGLYFGQTDSSADLHYAGIEGMAADGFYETDDLSYDEDDTASAVLRGEATFGSVTASLSYAMGDGAYGDLGSGDLHSMQLAAIADLGTSSVGMAYQANDALLGNYDEVIAIFGSTTFSGVDLSAAAASNSTSGEESFGIDVSYPAGPVTVGAAYSVNSVADDYWEVRLGYATGPVTVDAVFESTDDWGIEGAYDVGNGLVVSAGIVDAGDDYYLAGDYDLGSDATFFGRFVEDGGTLNGDNEIGANDYARGTTVGVSFEF